MRDKTRIALLLVLIILSVGLVSCADDGRQLAEPAEWQTTTTRPPPPTSALTQETSSSGVTLSSPDFEPGDIVPLNATCGGDNVFPNLDWANVPGGTGELALTLVDQTDPAEPLLMWLMAGIDPSRKGIQSGFLPDGAYESLNDYGNPGYGTPCLDGFASGLRDLQFRLYVLPGDSGLQSGDPGNEAWDSLRAQATETASLLTRIEN